MDDREEGSTLRTVATVGIDLAKYVFQLSAVGAREQDVFRQRLSRSALKQFLATLPPATSGFLCGLLCPREYSYGHGPVHQA